MEDRASQQQHQHQQQQQQQQKPSRERSRASKKVWTGLRVSLVRSGDERARFFQDGVFFSSLSSSASDALKAVACAHVHALALRDGVLVDRLARVLRQEFSERPQLTTHAFRALLCGQGSGMLETIRTRLVRKAAQLSVAALPRVGDGNGDGGSGEPQTGEGKEAGAEVETRDRRRSGPFRYSAQNPNVDVEPVPSWTEAKDQTLGQKVVLRVFVGTCLDLDDVQLAALRGDAATVRAREPRRLGPLTVLGRLEPGGVTMPAVSALVPGISYFDELDAVRADEKLKTNPWYLARIVGFTEAGTYDLKFFPPRLGELCNVARHNIRFLRPEEVNFLIDVVCRNTEVNVEDEDHKQRRRRGGKRRQVDGPDLHASDRKVSGQTYLEQLWLAAAAAAPTDGETSQRGGGRSQRGSRFPWGRGRSNNDNNHNLSSSNNTGDSRHRERDLLVALCNHRVEHGHMGEPAAKFAMDAEESTGGPPPPQHSLSMYEAYQNSVIRADSAAATSASAGDAKVAAAAADGSYSAARQSVPGLPSRAAGVTAAVPSSQAETALLWHRQDFKDQYRYELSLLFLAIASGSVECVDATLRVFTTEQQQRWAISCQAIFLPLLADPISALTLAAACCHADVVEHLLTLGAKPMEGITNNMHSYGLLTPLTAAIKFSMLGNQESLSRIVGLLLDAGDRGHHGCFSALAEAAKKGNAATVRLLLENNVLATSTTVHAGATGKTDKSGNAGTERREQLVLDTSDMTGPPAKQDRVHLHPAMSCVGWHGAMLAAMYARQYDSLHMLLHAHGRLFTCAERERCHRENYRALIMACEFGEVRFLDLLLRYEWSISPHPDIAPPASVTPGSVTATDISRMLPLPLCASCERGSLPMASRLLALGADVNETLALGTTPLFRALNSGYEDLVVLFINSGADLNKKLRGRETPLNMATRQGFDSVVRTLLSMGVNPNKRVIGQATAMHTAAEHGRSKIAQALANSGGSVNVFNVEGHSPLARAIIQRHWDTGKTLIALGADPTSMTENDGATLQQFIQMTEDEELESLLLAYVGDTDAAPTMGEAGRTGARTRGADPEFPSTSWVQAPKGTGRY